MTQVPLLRFLSGFLTTFGVVTILVLAFTPDQTILYYTETYSVVEARVLMALMALLIGVVGGWLIRRDIELPRNEDVY